MQGQSTSNSKSLSEPRNPPPPPPPPDDETDEPLEIVFSEELAGENPAPVEDETESEKKDG